MRAIFDTNVVVAALVFAKRLAWLRLCWTERRITPVVCKETVSELLRVLQYPKFRLTSDDREALLADYLPFAETATIGTHPDATLPICRDPDDQMFLRLALEARVEYLVTGDGDLTSIQTDLPFKIVSTDTLRLILN